VVAPPQGCKDARELPSVENNLSGPILQETAAIRNSAIPVDIHVVLAGASGTIGQLVRVERNLLIGQCTRECIVSAERQASPESPIQAGLQCIVIGIAIPLAVVDGAVSLIGPQEIGREALPVR